MEESYQQGDEERGLGIPVNPLGDRNVSIEKCQVCFDSERVWGVGG